MDAPGIDNESLPAVKSLRSKFEQLSATNGPPTTQLGLGLGHPPNILLTPDKGDPSGSASPRQRASSNTTRKEDDRPRLRSASSSSDIKAAATGSGTGKRPPPPPPIKKSPRTSPTPSPLLRPVPVPHSLSIPGAAALRLDSDHENGSPSGNVASIRSQFTSSAPPTPPRTHTPRQSTSNIIIHSENTSTTDLLSRRVPPPPPSIYSSSSASASTSTFHHRYDSSSSSRTSSEDASTYPINPPTPPRAPPIRSVPPRSIPPKLPVRRAPGVSSPEDITPPSSYVPRLPLRPQLSLPPNTTDYHSESVSPSTWTPTKSFSKFTSLPPPPTRTIALTDRLPPARPVLVSSDDDSDGAEDGVNTPITMGGKRPQAMDALPDSSRSSRRPPTFLGHSPKVHVPAHAGHVVVCAGVVVVGCVYSLTVYHTVAGDNTQVTELDIRTLVPGLSKSDGAGLGKISCMEWRVPGRVVWVGTKEGTLVEVDISSALGRAGRGKGAVVKVGAHSSVVTHLFRYGRNVMISIEHGGKCLIFGDSDIAQQHPPSSYHDDSDGEDEESLLTTSQPKVFRITEKQDFVKLLGGKLWTAARNDQHSAGTANRTPVIRLYDIFSSPSSPSSSRNPSMPKPNGNSGGSAFGVSAVVGRSLVPTEHVGPVTSATIVPSQPGFVYVGHEEGFITVWQLEHDPITTTTTATSSSLAAVDLTPYPKCVDIVKVSASDVLSLEGVNDRLWAGGRNGMISAFEVGVRPWCVRNCWEAHRGVPVLRIGVDVYGIGNGIGKGGGRLVVGSVGRDERMRFWDGLLGDEWIDQELIKRETSFSRFRDLSVLIVSWNVDAARPDSLDAGPEAANVSFLQDVLTSMGSAPPPDIISFGFQEVIDLESRKMTAKNVILGGGASRSGSKKHHKSGHHATENGPNGGGSYGGGSGDAEAGLSTKVTGAYTRWYERLVYAVRMAMPADVPYSVIHTESLVGLFSCIFVKNTERVAVKDVAITTIKRGMGGRYGNKGGIVARLVIEDSSICLINCHLAAGQHAVRQRNADVAGMLEDKAVFPVTAEPLAYVGGGDGSMVMDHEIVFINGDMNYRIDQRYELTMAAIRANEPETLLGHDQLLKEIKFNRGFRLRGFCEGPLTFAPTYKYDRRSTEYDTSEKRRSPAWCDRVLWRARVPSRVAQRHYRRYEANVSDHRPISAGFTMTIKSVRHEVREKVKAEVQLLWRNEQERLLVGARVFYVGIGLL